MKKILGCMIGCFLIVILFISLGMSNKNSKELFNTPSVYHSTGEEVSIGNNFFDSVSENPDGYTVQICDATVKSIEEYMSEIGVSETSIPLFDEFGYPRTKYVYDVKIKISNDNNTDGFVLISRYMLIDKALVLDMDLELFELRYPDLAGTYAVTLSPHSEYELVLPFTASPGDRLRYENEINSRMLEDKFVLCISEYPIRQLLHVN